MKSRISLALLWGTMVVAGGLTALAADTLAMPGLRDKALAVVLLGAVVFGLEMIVTRRAEISTRDSSTITPSFHVFRGWSAIAWGVSVALFTGTLLGVALIQITGWTQAEEFFRERPGWLVVLAGVTVIAFGVGSAGRATYRYRTMERPAPRLGDRLAGGLAVLSDSAFLAPAFFEHSRQRCSTPGRRRSKSGCSRRFLDRERTGRSG